ncbi:CHASE3 domain-containing protein [Erythrobacter sp. LQ02-29]|uniref:sensor histidine kinase n=1 Tax=Erythrobacter sp. LQ02-29 TaxID=2920384 RepID=UPI001F4E4A77|nr:CHASE3 domain-containing protein [Erythrobacter sp. LQ02-29]MCP9221529.1 CHASE3 domain-containing protein [Erythrobacter sp. LQ02-29]
MTGRSTRWLVLALVALALFASVWLIFQTVSAERMERAQVERTTQTMNDLRDIERLALAAETAQRGYYITLDRRYLEPWTGAHDRARTALGRLERRIGPTATEPERELLNQISLSLDDKFAELDETIGKMRDRELADARTRILTGDGIEAMQRLESAIGQFERIEAHALAVRAEKTAQVEARMLPLIGGLLALLLVALLLGMRLLARVAGAEAEAAQAQVLAEARDRADLLARELNHRVKNIFAIVLALVQMSGRDSPEAKPVLEKVGNRVRALLSAHEVTQGRPGHRRASLRDLLEVTLKPYRDEADQPTLDGPDVRLSQQQVTPLGLVLHECATNAVKYGCWASEGELSVRWWIDGETVRIEWLEECGTPVEPSERKGFGGTLMEGSARQLGGTIERTFTGTGMSIAIAFPNAAEHEQAGTATT